MTLANNPVQIVLNASNYLVRPDSGGGGTDRDFFAGNDKHFAEHKAQILSQIGQIERVLEANSNLGVEYVHVSLQNEALAKTHRPIRKVFQEGAVAQVGATALGDIVFELTTENIAGVTQAIAQAETEVKFTENTDRVLVARPSRIRSEVGAIRSVRPHSTSDRRDFTVAKAVEWLQDPRTGGMYLVETFVRATELGRLRPRAQRALQQFIQEARRLEIPVEVTETSAEWKSVHFFLFRVLTEPRESTQDVARKHRGLLEWLDRQTIVRKVLLPPILHVGQTQPPTAGPAAVALAAPDPNDSYPIMGIVDTGVSKVPSLDNWRAGGADFITTDNQDRTHGTFIAGLAVGATSLNPSTWLREMPCKFFDLDLHPTDASQYGAFYKRGFLDMLEQLNAELAAATQVGVRVFNMSLSVESLVSDSSYSPHAIMIDEIADRHDIVFVVPAGNLTGHLTRGSWPVASTDVVRMLADYRYQGQDRLFQPAESVRSITVGALEPAASLADCRPARYSRRGPSSALGAKPDLAHVGGAGAPGQQLNSVCPKGLSSVGSGTSYAAPLVARTLAALDHVIEGEVLRETLYSLAVHHATVPDCIASKKALAQIARDFVGFGIPSNALDMLTSDDHQITLVFTGLMMSDRELVFPFSWPPSLVGARGSCRGRARLTLAYRPATDRHFGAEYVRSNLDVFLRQEHIDEETGEVKWRGRLKSDSDKTLEKSLIEHGQKWWPLKRIERTIPKGVGKSSQWRLVVEPLWRAGAVPSPEGIPFAVVLTIADHDKVAPVFNELRRSLQTSGAVLSDIRTAQRITSRLT